LSRARRGGERLGPRWRRQRGADQPLGSGSVACAQDGPVQRSADTMGYRAPPEVYRRARSGLV